MSAESHTSSALEVILPSMGEGIHEATLVKWLKKTGDQVQKDEPLLEVSTDKVDTEIPAPHSGFLLQTVAEAGSTIDVNATIAWIGPKDATIPAASQNPGLSSTSSSSKANSKGTTTPVTRPVSSAATKTIPMTAMQEGELLKKTSPLVRKMAQDYGVDLRRVLGTGLNGKITKEDMYKFLASPMAFAEPAHTVLGQQVLDAPRKLPTQINNGVESLEGVPVRRETMTKMRRLIAEHMVESVRTSPHVTTTFEINLARVVAMREQFKEKFKSAHGVGLTFTPFFIRAAVESIKQFPIVNVSVDGDEILWKEPINIGCAVALGNEAGKAQGLIVPVIKGAEKMNLTDITLKLNDLANRARQKKLAADEVIGGTFSVTNPGGWGSVFSNPIINQPQVAMLGIGAVVQRPVVSAQGAIEVKPMMFASLTFDHRVIDGEGGALWLAHFKKTLENWAEEPKF
jgi:pyruvate dehydrogenase E2 component (dihydrolipoamide acetyltransferase)